MKILINTPDISLNGGVANYYKGLQKYWTENVNYNYVGGRKGIPGPIILIYDYIKFVFLCAFGSYDVIILNPSLGKTAIKRDALFLKIAKIFNKKVIVFFRGWDLDMVKQINSNPSNFLRQFSKTDKFLVLASSFKNDLNRWGFSNPIQLVTTKVEDSLIENLDLDKKQFGQTILFLTRIEKYKGIYTAIDAYAKVKKELPTSNFIIAGFGSQLDNAKKYVKDSKIEGVTFLGNVSGQNLINAFNESNVYIFPSHSEGMPNSVLEAMAFGLPIVTRPVGGLVDFFEQEKMGYMINGFNPEVYAQKIIELLTNEVKNKNISINNHNYVKAHFLASIVTANYEEIIRNVINK